ncbi:acetyl-CoA C-acetyltransferase [Candidatus Pelagibacter sp. Uisw_092]|jgi:acetyl-CoA C-acetyltransferase|uniref:acetyl-CoA C-acetyltransferase n=1 Tax=Candidatus Pelagibacter sp. Uisw_092 TaxID=3230979 RepID=UPI00231AB381|nr:acetyl-CoA C-acetyltransferase [Candidatus Pelagibacter sp.]MDC1236452.1 acetyl-CoA C-acetyltransferase [Pelagibacteraceae bacterium]
MSKKSNDVVITAALRTPIGTYKGSLKGLSADKLGALAIKEAVYKSKLKSDDIDEVIMGHVLTSGLGQNPARQASIHAGIPVSKPAHIINQVCGSGLRSVISGYQSIKLGENKIIVAGGQENMSRAPHTIFYREDKKLNENKLVDTMVNDGLIDSFNNYHMGVTAENVAEKYQISRDEQDMFALNSQKKTQDAISNDKFKNELIKLNINTDDKNFIFEKDEHPRSNLNLEDLKKLKTVFKENGTVTAGNSSGINDGAAATILMSREEAELRGIEPLAKVVSWATCGVEPSLMGLGPIMAVNIALEKAGWKIEDIDLFEVNEAFAAQSIAVIRDLKIPKKIVNVNGGAIALGHPIGASGTRILVTLIHEMIKQNKNKGCATLCIGGGMGIAMCIERN